jgi:hypothetical protein
MIFCNEFIQYVVLVKFGQLNGKISYLIPRYIPDRNIVFEENTGYILLKKTGLSKGI